MLATLRRLDKIEATLFDETGATRGGVLLVPPILGTTEWEAIALPTLSKLAQEAAEDCSSPKPHSSAHVHRTGVK